MVVGKEAQPNINGETHDPFGDTCHSRVHHQPRQRSAKTDLKTRLSARGRLSQSLPNLPTVPARSHSAPIPRGQSSSRLMGTSLYSSRAVPKIASNDRTKATIEEATAIVGGSIAYYGTYSVNKAEKSLSVVLEGSTFANLLGGPAQQRLVTSLTASELKFANPRTPSGMTLQSIWKRAQSH